MDTGYFVWPDPLPHVPGKVADRFIAKTRFDPSSGCVLWTAARYPGGYGAFGVPRSITGDRPRTRAASRVAYEFFVGEIPEGLFACHDCDNPPCVRLSHLYVGTQIDNMRDACDRGRIQRGERHYKTAVAEEQAAEIRAAIQRGERYRDIADRHGLRRSAVALMATGKRWGHLGPKLSDPARMSRPGSLNEAAKLTEADVVEILNARAHGVSAREMALQYGCHVTVIYRILNGRSWAHVEPTIPRPLRRTG